MKKHLLFSLFICGLLSPTFAQQKDEDAIKRAIQKETDSYYAGNYDQWANTWAHEPYILWTTNSGEEGGHFKMMGWSVLNGNMKSAFEDRKTPWPIPKFVRENYVVRQNATMAFATFDQVQTNSDGSARRSRESRVLEKQGNDWKLIYAAILAPKAEPDLPKTSGNSTTKADLPKLTDAQKAEMLAFNSTAVHAGSIAYAKSIGKTSKEYGQAIGKLFIPSWKQGPAAGQELRGLVEHMNGIAQAFGTSFEVVNWSGKEAVIKRGMLLSDPRMSGLFTSVGVTDQDLESWNEGVMSEIATSLGYSLSQRQDGKDVVVTVKKL